MSPPQHSAERPTRYLPTRYLPTRYLIALLFDQSAREEHAADPDGAMARFGLTPAQARAFRDVDLEAVAVDAEARARYLMSALCRAYPLSATALGSAPGGEQRLRAVLASPEIIAGPARRNQRFGAHLDHLLDLDPMGAGRTVTDFLRPFLALERAVVDNAARLRSAAAEGTAPPAPERPGRQLRRHGTLHLAPALVAVRLPASPEVLRTALHGVTAASAWQHVQAPGDGWERVVAVARAAGGPGGGPAVTFLARGVVQGVARARGGAGGVAPLVEVHHQTVELAADADGLLRQADGTMGLSDLPPRQQRLAEALVDAGILVLRQ